MKDDHTNDSHYLTYTSFFRKVGGMYSLSLGVKGLMHSSFEFISLSLFRGHAIRREPIQELWTFV